MKIRYQRSGGVTGIRVSREFEFEELPENLQKVLNSLTGIESSPPAIADDFLHEVHWEDGRKISCYDSRCSPEQLELFDFLIQPQRR